MSLEPLPCEDATILRRCAIAYFKQRFPKYSKLKLSLRQNALIVGCGKRHLISSLIREMKTIADEASIAIGISCVILEINGQKMFSYEYELGEKEMVLLEEEIAPINSYRQLIDNISAPTTEEDSLPEAIPLIGISELALKLARSEKELLRSLDRKNQYFFNENKASILAAFGKLLGEKVDPKVIEEALQPIDLLEMSGNYGIRASDVGAANLRLSVQEIPAMLQKVLEELEKWNPDCIREVAPNATANATEATAPLPPSPTPAKRGRKPKVAKTAEELSAEQTEPPKQKRYQISAPEKEKVSQAIAKSIENNRWKNAAKAFLKAIGDQAEEFLASALELDERYIAFVDNLLTPIVKDNLGLAGKKATEKREEIKGKLSAAFVGMGSDEANSQESSV